MYISCAFALLATAGFECMLSFAISTSKGPWHDLDAAEAMDLAKEVDMGFVWGYIVFWVFVHAVLCFDIGRARVKAKSEQESAFR